MSKNALVLTSLITAIPGALLVFVTVMSFLRYAGGWSIGIQALSGLLLLIGLGLALMPVGIYVLGGPKAEKEAKAESESAAESAELVAAEESGETPASEELISDSSLEVDELGTDEFAMTGEVVTPDASGEDFDLGEEGELDEAVFEEEEDGPKKGKKK